MARLPKAAKILTFMVWCATFGTCAFGVVHSADNDPLQWPSAIVGALVFFAAVFLTVVFLVASVLKK